MMNVKLLALALSLVSGLSATEPVTRDPHREILRVMTYNTWYVFNKGTEEAAGRAFIKSRTPDVVGLQELTNIKPTKLQALGSAWDHPHTSLLKTSGFSVGLTSRWPITVIEKRIKGMHHGYLHAKSNDVHYFVIHLSPFKWEVRAKEARIILEKVIPLLKAGEKVIVMGDFNALSPEDRQWLLADKELLPDMKKSDEKHEHVENLKKGNLDFSVMDTFLGSNLADTGHRFIPKKPEDRMTIPTGVWTDRKTPPEKGQRIDFILSGPELFRKIKSSRIIRKGEVNQISDHYPVITDFEMD